MNFRYEKLGNAKIELDKMLKDRDDIIKKLNKEIEIQQKSIGYIESIIRHPQTKFLDEIFDYNTDIINICLQYLSLKYCTIHREFFLAHFKCLLCVDRFVVLYKPIGKVTVDNSFMKFENDLDIMTIEYLKKFEYVNAIRPRNMNTIEAPISDMSMLVSRLPAIEDNLMNTPIKFEMRYGMYYTLYNSKLLNLSKM